MKRLVSIFLVLCLLLTGCGWMDGAYHSVTPHEQHSGGNDSQLEVVENYLQLRTALENMVTSGTESHVISVVGFPEDRLLDNLDMAVRFIKKSYPIGAYAVEEITYEVGTIGGIAAVAEEITYIHEKREIRKDRKNPELLFTHNYVRQGFYSPVAIRKLAVTKLYPCFMKLRNSSGAGAFVKQSSLLTY